MVKRERSFNPGGILGDEMGLGKTVTSLATILANPASGTIKRPTLIVVPSNLLDQWQREIIQYTNLQAIQHCAGRRAYSSRDFGYVDIVLSTYDILKSEGLVLAVGPSLEHKIRH